LFNITGGKDLSLAEVSQISKSIFGTVNKEAKIIFGISQNKKGTDKIKVNLLANGCQAKIFPSEPKKTKIKVKAVPKKTKRKRKKRKSKLLKIKKKIKASRKKRKKTKIKKPSTKIKKIRKEKFVQPAEKEINNASLPTPEEKIEIKVRRNALQVQEADKEAEKEIIEKEKFWEPPAFLRKRKLF
jgi:cell division protein FtsZ